MGQTTCCGTRWRDACEFVLSLFQSLCRCSSNKKCAPKSTLTSKKASVVSMCLCFAAFGPLAHWCAEDIDLTFTFGGIPVFHRVFTNLVRAAATARLCTDPTGTRLTSSDHALLRQSAERQRLSAAEERIVFAAGRVRLHRSDRRLAQEPAAVPARLLRVWQELLSGRLRRLFLQLVSAPL